MSIKNTNVAREPLIRIAKRASLSPWKSWGIRVIAFLLSMLVCGLLALILIEKIRLNPEKLGKFFECFINGSFSTNRRFWKFLKDLSILLCISLAVTPAFRMRFWNIGAEGQTLVGILGCIAVDFYLGGKIPEVLLLVLMFVAAIVSASIWGLIPALFKAKWNTNETLFTLMMNYIATYLVGYFLIVWVPSGSSSLGKLKTGKLPSFGHDYLVIILVTLLITGFLYIYLNYSKHGYEIAVVGESENTARYVGINVKKVIIRTMLVSGALCGLAGYLIGAGLDQSVTADSVGGRGFTAIMVSWLAKFNPIFMVLTSALITALNQGAAQISLDFGVSDAFPNMVVGIILFFIIGSEFFINYEVHFRGKNQNGQEALKS